MSTLDEVMTDEAEVHARMQDNLAAMEATG